MAYLDAVQDADSYWDARHREQEAQEAAEIQMEQEFIAAVRKGDMHARAEFGHQVTERVTGSDGKPRIIKRTATVGECLQDACDYGDEWLTPVFQVLADAAKGQDVQRAAADLVRELARTYASHHAEASHD